MHTQAREKGHTQDIVNENIQIPGAIISNENTYRKYYT